MVSSREDPTLQYARGVLYAAGGVIPKIGELDNLVKRIEEYDTTLPGQVEALRSMPWLTDTGYWGRLRLRTILTRLSAVLMHVWEEQVADRHLSAFEEEHGAIPEPGRKTAVRAIEELIRGENE